MTYAPEIGEAFILEQYRNKEQGVSCQCKHPQLMNTKYPFNTDLTHCFDCASDIYKIPIITRELIRELLEEVKDVACPLCNGVGSDDEGECPNCDGTGKWPEMTREASLFIEALREILEDAHLRSRMSMQCWLVLSTLPQLIEAFWRAYKEKT